MVKFKVNLDELLDGFIIYDPGNYAAKLVGCEKKTSSTGNPMLEWSWEIIQGDYKGKTLKSWTSMLLEGSSSLKIHLTALGYKKVSDVNTEKDLGKKVVLTVTKELVEDKETHEDKPVNRVKYVKTLTETESIQKASAKSTGVITVDDEPVSVEKGKVGTEDSDNVPF